MEEAAQTPQDRFGMVAIEGAAALIPAGFEEAMVVTTGLPQTEAVLGLGKVGAQNVVAIASGAEEAAALERLGVPPAQIVQRSFWNTLQETQAAATRLAQELLQGRGVAVRILDATARTIQALLTQLEQLLLPDAWQAITAETFDQIQRINQLGV